MSEQIATEVAAITAGPLRITAVAERWAEWERYIAQAPDSTFCHRAGWRRVMQDVLRQKCEYLVAEDESGWRGVLPLVHVRGLLGHYLVSMPFVNDGGPLGDEDTRRQLVSRAVQIAGDSGAKLLELRARQPLDGPVQTNSRKIGVMLPLPATVDELWSKTFKAKLRSQVRRPAKEGMIARAGAQELDAFYRVFARNMRDLGTPVLPRAFFEQLVREFGNDVLFVTVYSAAGVPTAGSCCLIWRDEMEVTWASSLREYNKLSPNMLLYSRMMELAIERGMRVFNFGRSTPGASTHRFKQQWGGEDVPLPWAVWSRAGDAGTPSPDKPVMKLATSVWSRLPVGVANRLGPVLARQLP